jgi:hypothetical protein
LDTGSTYNSHVIILDTDSIYNSKPDREMRVIEEQLQLTDEAELYPVLFPIGPS